MDLIKSIIKNRSKLFWPIFILGVVCLIFIQYYGLVTYHYAVPPGDDPANHYQMIKPFYDRTGDIWTTWKNGGYPPGYHLFIASLSHLFHAEPLKVMLWFYPIILVLAGIAIFLTTYFIFGPWAGLLAFVIYGFTTTSPIQLLNDGGYPNLLAGHVFLPLAVLFFIKFFQERKKLYILPFVLASLMVLFTHHISTFIFFAIICTSIPFLIVYYGFEKKWIWQKVEVYVVGYLLILLALLVFFYNSSLLAPARSMLDNTIRFSTRLPFIRIIGQADPTALLPVSFYPKQIGPIAIYGGLASLVLLPVLLIRKKNNKLLIAYVIALIWIAVLYAGSRQPYLTNPERLGRDLAVPLSIITGATIVYVLEFLNFYPLVLFATIITLISFFWLPVKNRIGGALAYQPMVRITKADLLTIQFIKDSHPQPGTLLVRDYNYYIPFFLPDWNIAYSPTDALDKKYIKQFNYVYLVSRREGWVPRDFAADATFKYYFDPDIIEDYQVFDCKEKEIYVIKIKE